MDKISHQYFALYRLEKILLETLDYQKVVQKVVDGVFNELLTFNLGYQIVVLSLIDEEKNVLKRVTVSQTPEALKGVSGLPVPYTQVEIPLDSDNNFCVLVMKNFKPIITHDWKDILSPPLTEQQARDLQNHVGIKTSAVFPLIVQGKAVGSMIFSTLNDMELDDEEISLLSQFTDIIGVAVQNSRLYYELDQANEKLKELDKRKDEFVSVASHELRTPMTAIRSYLWLALAGKAGDLNEKQKHYVDRAYTSTIRLIKLVNDMLNISRIESGRLYVEPEKIDLIKLADDVLIEVKPRADELNVTVSLTKSPLPLVLGDADKLKEVFINLIGNSLKFTHPGGKINLSFEVKDNLVVTNVTDDGEGLEPQDLDKLFQKFGLVAGSYVTNQNAAQGTGLGLYICKSIVELLGGKIWVTSPGKGQGATFSFSLKIFNDLDFENIKRLQEGKQPLGIIHSALE